MTEEEFERLRQESYNRARDGLNPLILNGLKRNDKMPQNNTPARKPTKPEKKLAKVTMAQLKRIYNMGVYIEATYGAIDAAFAHEGQKIQLQAESMGQYIRNALQAGWWEEFVPKDY